MEIPRMCAIREVLEETGFDFGEHSDGNEFKIQVSIDSIRIEYSLICRKW